MNRLSCWIEAMRLRTLPVSIAGVVMACGLAIASGEFSPLPASLCLAFAVLAQIASNFGNEYYDYRDGLDSPGRQGPRRGVTEGDITPRAMLRATYLTLALACCIGLCLIHYGGWWLLPVGIAIALGAMAYSTGPYPLSRHGLGEVAVIAFFGIIPVSLTFYVQALHFSRESLLCGLAMGLMGANVLIVNNYRDADADRIVGKRTLAVILGRRAVRLIYLINGLVAVALTGSIWVALPQWAMWIPVIYLTGLVGVWIRMDRCEGHALTPMLAITSLLMLFYSLGYLILVVVNI
ncbi:MAG: 1,4-dihydroxy-2-naphthoate octaprenyltransferase [Bacteroides sp.]|nr:1,4-dihydroxy-2-naphthoate octaprenyltransferase [Bacteroides sp.]MCM1412985.1 1,4-dihydroxy-2-naphthoate octaprenyltransferase [Bacteroides sp.]MCM1471691.1 1,4-dihydroxy-2-naphthoate octaprenyltransferase [Bacteroides sp.]